MQQPRFHHQENVLVGVVRESELNGKNTEQHPTVCSVWERSGRLVVVRSMDKEMDKWIIREWN